jgi:5-methylcytosine-specific restriction enzyme subunit McrC
VAEDAADLPDLLGRLLAFIVERRLRRNLSRGYLCYSAVLTRVRGQIDILRTESKHLLKRGRIACRFDELTVDTPRNRLARAALEKIASAVKDRSTAHRCRTLARDLMRLGVSADRPSRSEMMRDQIARHDTEERSMVTVAQLALDRVLPSEADGSDRVTRLHRDAKLLREIFEKAVTGFYRHEVHGQKGWQVHPQQQIKWPAMEPTSGLRALLPHMKLDIVLENLSLGRRLVVDTKFTSILTTRQHGGEGLSSEHIFQLYAYLRSQACDGTALADNSSGILLYPAIAQSLDEAVTIQGHRIRFATVDLSLTPRDIRDRLLALIHAPI